MEAVCRGKEYDNRSKTKASGKGGGKGQAGKAKGKGGGVADASSSAGSQTKNHNIKVLWCCQKCLCSNFHTGTKCFNYMIID